MTQFITTSASTEEFKNFYFASVSKQKKISSKEEKELIARIQLGDQKAQDRLVCGNLAYVISEVKKFQGRGLPLEDLIQEGNLGLIKAAKKFDEAKENRFITYAYWWIRDSVQKALDDNDRHMYESLDDNIFPGEDEIRLDRISQCCFAAPDSEVEEQSLDEKLFIAMHATLKQKEIDILCQFYGIGCDKKKEKDLALEYGLSRVRISQIINEATDKLRGSRYSEELRMCC